MIWFLVRKEIWMHLTTLRVVGLLVLFMALTIANMCILAADYQRNMEVYSTSMTVHHHEREKIPHTWGLLFYGLKLARPPSKVGILARGLDEEIGGSFKLNNAGAYKVGESPLYQNPIISLSETPDFLFVVKLLGSLMAILLLYDAVVGERERGTLALCLSNQVPRGVFLLGKWMGSYIVLLIALAFSLLMSLLVVETLMGIAFTLEELARISGMFFIAAQYIGVFCALGLLASTFSRSSSMALLLALLSWIVFVLMLPGLTRELARDLLPVSSPSRVESERYHLAMVEQQALDRKRRYGGRFGIDRKERRRLEDESRHQTQTAARRMEERYLVSLARQEQLVRVLSRLSPVGSLVNLSTGLAQTGGENLRRVRESMWLNQETFVSYCEQTMKAIGRETQNNFKDLPQPLLPKWEAGQWLEEAWIDIGALFLWGGIFLLLSLMRFIRADVS